MHLVSRHTRHTHNHKQPSSGEADLAPRVGKPKLTVKNKPKPQVVNQIDKEETRPILMIKNEDGPPQIVGSASASSSSWNYYSQDEDVEEMPKKSDPKPVKPTFVNQVVVSPPTPSVPLVFSPTESQPQSPSSLAERASRVPQTPAGAANAVAAGGIENLLAAAGGTGGTAGLLQQLLQQQVVQQQQQQQLVQLTNTMVSHAVRILIFLSYPFLKLL